MAKPQAEIVVQQFRKAGVNILVYVPSYNLIVAAIPAKYTCKH